MKRPLAATALLVLLLCSCSDTSLLLQVQDSVSGAAVWDLTVNLQDRQLRSFFQTDAGPVPQRLTHLAPGPSRLEASAPGYETLSVPVTLARGKNRLPEPLRLVGEEIPGLAGFAAFENVKNGDIAVQLRPLDGSGKAIVHHPCMDLWIGCAVYEETVAGVPAGAEGAAGAARGAELFRGVLPWSWDSRPETLFRYSAHIPSSGMRDAASLYRVIDYLVIVPDPSRVPRSEIDSAMAAAWVSGPLVLGSPARSASPRLQPKIAAALDAWKGGARAFLVTSWDVRARQS